MMTGTPQRHLLFLALAAMALPAAAQTRPAAAAPGQSPSPQAQTGQAQTGQHQAGQSQSPPAGNPERTRHDAPRRIDSIVVTATPFAQSAEDLVRPVDVLSDQKLDEAKASSLGETVSRLPGVQGSYFGPGVGRPIVRGMDGARVQVLSGGMGSGDVSTVSADHAVSIEPFLAGQVEVLKGPATLLYGSGAIGGAVNVVDGRTPQSAPDDPFQGRAELRGDSVNDGRTGMLRIDAGSRNGLVLHVDALHRETGDYAIPGYAESAARLAAEGEIPDPADRGRLPNSALRTDAGALGLSWIGDRGFVGGSASLFSTRYGIPGHAHAGEEGGDVRIAMEQRRHEVRAGLDDLGVFRSARLKFADTAYTHREIEGGAVGTTFENASREARLELLHRPLAGWEGALGLQWAHRDFNAIGEEAFVPASASRETGLFWVGRRNFGRIGLEIGARHERASLHVDPAAGPDRGFATTSLSFAGRWNIGEHAHLSLGLDRARRAPTAEELYSRGLHVATQSFELGNAWLRPETANNVEFGAHWHGHGVDFGLSAYRVRFDDFIYLADGGAAIEDTPVRLWTQQDAQFTGAEASVDWRFHQGPAGSWNLRLFGDVVRARLQSGGATLVPVAIEHEGEEHAFDAVVQRGGNLPRLAPARAGAELRWQSARWRASLGAVRYARQDRVAAGESPTPGYTLVDAHLAWHRDTQGANAWELFLDGSNLLDAEARPHTSFLKDLAPLPGRNLAFGVRLFF